MPGWYRTPVVSRVYVSEHGNVFMREIAEHLVEALTTQGRPAELVTAELPSAGDPLDHLVVAPHEFFALFPAPEADRLRAAAHAVSINTEQPGTPFFDTAVRYAQLGPAVLDISVFSLDALRRLGLRAVHLPLGYVASLDRWQRNTSAERTIDLAVLGGRTPRREAFIGAAGAQLWEWRTDLRLFSWHRPARAGQASFSVGDDKYERLAQTRILLNVHRNDEPYFEWARVVEAIANGCVVATETSVGIEPLVAGTHVLVAPLDSLAEQAVALAFDEPRRAALAEAAYDVLRCELDQGRLTIRALDEVARLIATSSGSNRPRPRRLGSVVRRGTSSARSVAARGIRALSPAPSATDTARNDDLAARLKRAVLAQQGAIRSIERSLALVRHGDADHVTVTRSAAVGLMPPTVSVVIPLYNQGHYLREAIDSVVAAAGAGAPPTEIIVVDDHSTDTSLETALALANELPWFPITVLARAANGGLPIARNTGFGASNAPYVFALDADNVLYPNGLRLLAAHLDRAPSDVLAAYGLLERFDESGSVGLTSHLPWDVDLLVHGAYIDAMAMFRREAWRSLGGYTSHDGIHGWEDYDLWLTAAEHGLRADLVTSIVGRYREQAGSMRRISDIDMASNFVTLRERHPRLPWPS